MPSANTLVRWVNENAFAFIVQARPCPTFGRPVHLRGSPHRLQPGTSPHALRIPPRDGHPALRRTASGGSRSALAVSSFRLRARLGFSIPSSLSGPRGITPAFGYGAPHPSARGTSTLLNNALLSAHYEPLGLPPGSAHFQPSGLIRPVFARLGCRVGSLLFRDALCKRATAPYPGKVQHSFRSCGVLSVAFAVT